MRMNNVPDDDILFAEIFRGSMGDNEDIDEEEIEYGIEDDIS